MSADVVNHVTGEASLSDDERDVTYHLVFSIEAVASIERMTGTGVLDIIERGRMTLTETAMIIVAGTAAWSKRHPGAQKALNPKLALRLIVGAGGLVAVMDTVLGSLIKAEGLGLFDPDDEEAATAADDGDADSSGDPFSDD